MIFYLTCAGLFSKLAITYTHTPLWLLIMKKYTLLLTALLLTLLSGCSEESALEKTSAEQVNKKELLFFMNPDGRPCQIQDQLLQQMGTKLTAKASIKYIKTTEMATAKAYFRKYGIRALPTIIILDKKGNVEHRLPPGIHKSPAIFAIL